MSIATRTGDQGTTSLIFNRRVSKTDPRIRANGMLDELNARLGMAKALLPPDDEELKKVLERMQRTLIGLMGEIAVAPQDFEAFGASRMQQLGESDLEMLDKRVAELEGRDISFAGWATPGANPASAALDLARTGCRAAEVEIVAIHEAGLLNPDKQTLIFQTLNRFSDMLWLEARRLEA